MATPQTGSTSSRPLVATLDVAAKILLVVLLVVAVAYPDLGNLRDKAMGFRAVAYPLGAAIVPLLWWWLWRPRGRAYPWLGDLLVTLPWLTDTLGNRLDLFDSVRWFDDWMHFMNWGLLTAGFVVLTLPRDAALGAVVERALAFGPVTAIGWELGEYVAFVRHSPELETAYTDTLGDLSLGSLGAVIGALLVHAAVRSGRVHEEPVTGRPAPSSAAQRSTQPAT
ncbi:hypothetical protein H4N58_08715 [Mumia sp. ZJ1417]|uniref:hypothetical protein n=1 Tax=Mumia sp. ZJ1417 TaxID=2708082 RepID=UPI00141D815D|nr:hypothetical protein [Mumia sp. ZJ1417]QMW67913.1 hypothetical protein H4N58_08715 [Mumia sp. ZJ1417]